jgi:hypothetical protein
MKCRQAITTATQRGPGRICAASADASRVVSVAVSLDTLDRCGKLAIPLRVRHSDAPASLKSIPYKSLET